MASAYIGKDALDRLFLALSFPTIPKSDPSQICEGCYFSVEDRGRYALMTACY